MKQYYIWISASGCGPIQDIIICIIDNKEYKIDKNMFDDWTLEDVFYAGLESKPQAINCYKKCSKFSISCQRIKTGEIIAKKEFIRNGKI